MSDDSVDDVDSGDQFDDDGSDDPLDGVEPEEPFDDIDADEYRGREGDPFDELDTDDAIPDGATPDDPTPGGADEGEPGGDGPAERDPFEYMESDDGSRSSAQRTSDEGGDSDEEGDADGERRSVDVVTDPFSDVDVSRGDPFEAADTPFEREAIDGVDPDEVWERFTADAESATTTEDDAPETDDVVEVSKHSFCEKCPRFSEPPAVECGHEGTSILEFVGTENVRIANCPVVRERRELGEVHE